MKDQQRKIQMTMLIFEIIFVKVGPIYPVDDPKQKPSKSVF
ncbi:unnamed protein product [marine sediment metagenome]|uniref:Uncharacterized protein n=1 Tax=marine sediment metagenome TaxID=412755 RepID=X1Q1J4_9ZZZZ